MRFSTRLTVSLLALLVGPSAAQSALERRLYVTDASGISVYDIDSGHTLVRKIELPVPLNAFRACWRGLKNLPAESRHEQL